MSAFACAAFMFTVQCRYFKLTTRRESLYISLW